MKPAQDSPLLNPFHIEFASVNGVIDTKLSFGGVGGGGDVICGTTVTAYGKTFERRQDACRKRLSTLLYFGGWGGYFLV